MQYKEGVMSMATSTFAKEFKVKPERSRGFVREMTRKVTPTLKSDFKSQFMHEKDLEGALQKVFK